MQEQTNQEISEAGNERIQCRECGEVKERADFKKAENPTMCLACMRERRKMNRLQEQKITSTEKGKKEKLSLEVSPFCRHMVGILAVDRTKAEVLEEWAVRAYQEATEVQRAHLQELLRKTCK